MNLGFDYLIIVTAGLTRDSERLAERQNTDDVPVDKNSLKHLLKEDNDSTELLGRLIELDWCVYDVKKQIITDQFQRFVKGEDFIINAETLSKNKLHLCQFDGAVTFTKVIQEFNDHTYTNFTRNNKSFCFVSYGEQLMIRVLPREAHLQQMKLASHFFTYFDIAIEFKKNFPHAVSIKTLHEMLTYTNLQEKPLIDQSIAQFEISNIVRLTNMLARSGYVFSLPVQIIS